MSGRTVHPFEFASMRPGQTAPECHWRPLSASFFATCFNEAGADCPGMRHDPAASARTQSDASMRPGQTAPECQLRTWTICTVRKLQ